MARVFIMKIKKQWSVFKHWLNRNQHDDKVAFVKSFLKDPKAMGAIYPSSKRLAKIMASYAAFSQNQLIVELGAGTGVITQAMLNRGIPAERIIAIEFSPDLVENFRMHFPKIKVIVGDASHLAELLKNETRPIGTIISALPLRSLSKEMTERILSAIPAVLTPHGRYIQFTYDLRNNARFYPQQYQLVHKKLVWVNIPPAKVEVYTLRS
jgi:phosphatidylethanolamine/phosphatidyl-N-methylethanolamine N-methyltransferase